jgi:hypothetical protein
VTLLAIRSAKTRARKRNNDTTIVKGRDGLVSENRQISVKAIDAKKRKFVNFVTGFGVAAVCPPRFERFGSLSPQL